MTANARLAAVDFESTVSAIPPEGHVGARGGTRTRRTLILSQVRLPITSLAQKALELLFRRLLRATSFGALMKGFFGRIPLTKFSSGLE